MVGLDVDGTDNVVMQYKGLHGLKKVMKVTKG